MLNKDKDLKLYYSVSEVAEQFGVAPSLLRFWETEFPNIHPKKAGRGVRQYSKEDIEQVRLVYHLLKERGMTIEGARRVIRQTKGKKTEAVDVITRLKFVSEELQSISKALGELD